MRRLRSRPSKKKKKISQAQEGKKAYGDFLANVATPAFQELAEQLKNTKQVTVGSTGVTIFDMQGRLELGFELVREPLQGSGMYYVTVRTKHQDRDGRRYTAEGSFSKVMEMNKDEFLLALVNKYISEIKYK
ncbi:hypothetical protein [Deinococcus sp. Leaf326]|uniref:hypothetical protein n=1 Tax=Deinococcus sp. Leaf326 TaxID=1736338 RepID=UPI0012E2C5DD|nr:hypothetical protein [Deinococcus sp. Leaf326]